MQIGNRKIGPAEPPYIIAELGVNHDGDVRKALDLTRAAAQAGADAVKLQLFETDLLMSKAAKLAAYQKAAGETDPISMLRRLELTIEDMAPVVTLAHELNIHAIVTVFSVELVAKAETLPWDAYKTASPDIVHKPLLEALAATGKPLIVSTGASTMDEVKQAVNWLTATSPTALTEPRPSGSGAHASTAQGRPSGSGSTLPMRDRLAMMQCVSCYPTPVTQAEFGGIAAIRAQVGGVVGYSDHTSDEHGGRLAVGFGADLLEKHVTYSRVAQGPDHAASLEPDQFVSYCRQARNVFVLSHPQSDLARQATGRRFLRSAKMTQAIATPFAWSVMGVSWARAKLAGTQEPGYKRRWREALDQVERSKVKRVLPIEQDVRTVSRQSITTRHPLTRGHTLRREDLTFKRPGTGLLPFRLGEILGRQLTRDVEGDVPLTEEDLR